MNASVALGIGRSIAAASLRLPVTALLSCIAAYSGSAAADAPEPMVLAQAFVRPANPGQRITGVDLGLHWRYTSIGNYRFDVSAWRRMNPPDAATLIDNRDSSYGARVEMHLVPPPRSGFLADHGFLGLQLESGARITLHKGGGGKPMVYYRSKF